MKIKRVGRAATVVYGTTTHSVEYGTVIEVPDHIGKELLTQGRWSEVKPTETSKKVAK